MNTFVFKYYIYAIILYFFIFYTYFFSTKFKKTITVKDEFYNVGSTKNLLNIVQDTEDVVYTVSNKLLLLSFNSSEVLAQLEKNKTYDVVGYGVRIPYLDLYPNILHINKMY